MEFTGPSKHYVLQQTTLACKALAPLASLDPDSELQGLEAMLAVLEARRTQVLKAKADVVG